MRTFILFSLFLVLFSQTAYAATAKAKPVTKPSVSEPSATPMMGSDGRLQYCALEQKFVDQTRLTLAMSPAHQINFGLTIPQAGFTKGMNYELTYGFDDEPQQTVRAHALGEETVVLPLEVNPPFAKAIERAKSVVVGGGGKTLRYKLDSLHNAVKTLTACIADNKEKVDQTVMLPKSLQAFLAEAGLRDITPLPQGNVPAERRPADYMWRSGSLVGGVLSLSVPQEKDLSTLIGVHIEGLKQKCPGAFTAMMGAQTKVKEFTLRPAQISCQVRDDHQLVEAIIYSLNPDHTLTLFTLESDAAHQAEAIDTRDRLTQNMIKHANAKP